jgi:hypothetical protein
METQTDIVRWSFVASLVVYAVGFILYSLFVPLMDGNNWPRACFFLGLSLLYWARFLLGFFRQERDRSYRLYMVLILVSPFVWITIDKLFVGP